MQVCSFPAVLCGSELAASNSHRRAEVISLGLPQFFKQNETHHRFWKAEKISHETNAQLGKKNKRGRNNLRANMRIIRITTFSLLVYLHCDNVFSYFFKVRLYTLSSSELANFISCSQEGIVEIFILMPQARVKARIINEMFPAFRIIPGFSGNKACLFSVSFYCLV